MKDVTEDQTVDGVVEELFEIQDSAHPFEELVVIGRRKMGEENLYISFAFDDPDKTSVSRIAGSLETSKHLILTEFYKNLCS